MGPSQLLSPRRDIFKAKTTALPEFPPTTDVVLPTEDALGDTAPTGAIAEAKLPTKTSKLLMTITSAAVSQLPPPTEDADLMTEDAHGDTVLNGAGAEAKLNTETVMPDTTLLPDVNQY